LSRLQTGRGEDNEWPCRTKPRKSSAMHGPGGTATTAPVTERARILSPAGRPRCSKPEKSSAVCRPGRATTTGLVVRQRHIFPPRRELVGRQQVARLSFVQKPVRFRCPLPTSGPRITGKVFGHGRTRWDDNNRPRCTTRQQARECRSGAGVVYREGRGVPLHCPPTEFFCSIPACGTVSGEMGVCWCHLHVGAESLRWQ